MISYTNLATIYGTADAMGSTCDVNWSQSAMYPSAYARSPMWNTIS